VPSDLKFSSCNKLDFYSLGGTVSSTFSLNKADMN